MKATRKKKPTPPVVKLSSREFFIKLLNEAKVPGVKYTFGDELER